MIANYVGTVGTTFDVESPNELYEALDIVHTQVMDNLGEDSPYLGILETAIEKVDELRGGE